MTEVPNYFDRLFIVLGQEKRTQLLEHTKAHPEQSNLLIVEQVIPKVEDRLVRQPSAENCKNPFNQINLGFNPVLFKLLLQIWLIFSQKKFEGSAYSRHVIILEIERLSEERVAQDNVTKDGKGFDFA